MLTVYSLEQSEQWDKLVQSFAEYDVYYLSGYVKAFQIHGDGEPLLFYYDGDSIRGINVVMKRDVADDPHFVGKLPKNTCFDFATPYGYGGWVLEGTGDSKPLYQVYETWCEKNGIISEFVRFHPVLKNHVFSACAYEVVSLGETVVLDLSSPEVIWKNITSKNRNMIRKAVKNRIKIYNGHFPQIYETFRKIYNMTMIKDHADQYYYFGESFYESVLNDLPHNAQVFYAQLPDGTVIAASIILSANGRMYYHLSGSLKEYQNLAPTNLLLYEAALWGCENGCNTFYLGGGLGSAADSLLAFKKSFYRGEDLNRFYIGKRIVDQEKYQELIGMRTDIPEDCEFFPRYRA